MAGRIDGKVAIVTGGASGIGEGAVRLFAQEGGRVVVADIQDERGQALVESLGATPPPTSTPTWPTKTTSPGPSPTPSTASDGSTSSSTTPATAASWAASWKSTKTATTKPWTCC